jgi:hypothetical protein
MLAALRTVRTRPGQLSTLAAYGAAAGIAFAGAVVWGLLALLIHRQFPLVGLAIGLCIGGAVARLSPGRLATMVAGAVIAVAGCVFGTLLGQIFVLLNAQYGLSVILGHLNLVFRLFPGNVGVLGLLFYIVAALGAVREPLRTRRRSAQAALTTPGAETAAGPAHSPAAAGETPADSGA